jgi:hypothetical protein
MRDQDIDAFFRWFAANALALTRVAENQRLVVTLNEHIDTLNPDFAWEIGPGHKAEWSFALSPDGDESLSSATRYVISRAPKVHGWEFHAFRQPREAPPVVELEASEGTFEIDASDAEYALLRTLDGTFDMVVKLPATTHLRTHSQHALAVLLLDGLIGEEPRMSLIKNVEFVAEFAPQFQARATKLKHLREHLNEQVKREQGTLATQ